MGVYLNPANKMFKSILKSKIYVDKTDMIKELNEVIGVYEPLICIARPRRFGKSIAANTIAAYYSKGCDSRELFRGLKAEKIPSFEEHLNKHNVVYFDMQSLLSAAVKDLEHARKEEPDKYADTSVLHFVEKTLIEDTYHDISKIQAIKEAILWDSI